MKTVRAWWAQIYREYLEHRLAFFYFPVGVLAIMSLSSLSGLFANRLQIVTGINFPPTLKLFELGYLVVILLWLVYLAIALFFYFGDSFAADRRNNAMLFWKSMPLSDLRILCGKFLAGVTLFPLMIFVLAVISGVILYIILNGAAYLLPGFPPPAPLAAATSFVHVTAFGVVYLAFALIWYAPFMAWVGGLSAVFGRWSLPLAFVIPGLLAVIENMAFYSYIPRGGYVWGYLSNRLQFGLSGTEEGLLLASPAPFDVRTYTWLLTREIDWTQMGIGLVVAAGLIFLASQYRRRRIT